MYFKGSVRSGVNIRVTVSNLVKIGQMVAKISPFNGFYRASICKGGLGSRNSVRRSVCAFVCLSHAWIVRNLNGALQIC